MNPRYMAEVRKGLHRSLQDLDGNPHFDRRLFFVLEYLSVIKPSARAKFESVLSLPRLLDDRGYHTVSEVSAHLATLSDAQLGRLINGLLQEYPKAVEHVGGAVKDLLVVAQKNWKMEPSMQAFYERLRHAERSPENRDELIKWAAHLEVAILEFGKIGAGSSRVRRSSTTCPRTPCL